jgi:hypothetical protein
MIDTNISSFAEAERFAAEHGCRITAKDRESIQKAQEAERQRLQVLAQNTSSGLISRIVDGFNRLYPRFLEALLRTGDMLLTLTQTLIVAFGIPVILILLLIVEQQRVVHGIQLFEADPGLSAFAAWALVLLNLVMEITIVHIEYREGYHADASSRFSLRVWRDNIAYTLGLGHDWQERANSPAQSYRHLLRLITFTILALALAGSMRDVIAHAQGTWYAALVSIFTSSDLTEMMTWLGGLLFAAAAVFAAQGLSRYVGIRTVEIKNHMTTQQDAGDHEFTQQLEAVAVQFVLAKVTAAEARRQDKQAPGVAISAPLSTANGEKAS